MVQSMSTVSSPHNQEKADIIHTAYGNLESITPKTSGAVRVAVEETLNALDSGKIRVGEKTPQGWIVHDWIKKAILLSFRLNAMRPMEGGPGNEAIWWDKVPSKFENWTGQDFAKAGFRAVPNCVVRHSAYIAPGVVLMPSFVNMGAYVDEGTMVDTWATVGSCAQIGKNVHISGGAGIGGVLEPLQAAPVIIEDNCFIGARSEVAEGVVVEEGAVLSMGVFLTSSTKIINRATGEITRGRVPPYAVVVPGTIPPSLQGKQDEASLEAHREKPHLYCAVIVKQVDAKTRAKTSINDLLRY